MAMTDHSATKTLAGLRQGRLREKANSRTASRPSYEHGRESQEGGENRTKPLLSVPDDVVANALAAAQRALS